jgi:hypothetical protein
LPIGERTPLMMTTSSKRLLSNQTLHEGKMSDRQKRSKNYAAVQ